MNGRSRIDGGFALPMALLVLLITAGAVITTLNQSSSERRVVSSEAAADAALEMAETGLERVVTSWDDWGFAAPPLATHDSARVTFADGYADVVWDRLRPQSTNVSAVYLIRSRGVYTREDWAGSADATRAVTRYGQWLVPSLDVRSAWTALGGLRKSGGSGVISGVDFCGQSPAVAGVAVPTVPGYTQTGGASVPAGSPNILQLAPTPIQAADTINVNWASILNEEVFEFDLVIPPAAWPSFADPNYWPIIYIDNPGTEFNIPSDGRGVLIIRDDAKIAGSIDWDGVMLVGDKLTSSGNNTVDGSVITGLNLQLGEVVAESDLGSGNKTYRYNSCKVWDAFKSRARFRTLSNTWFDGWALY
jgi:hypothetical protein